MGRYGIPRGSRPNRIPSGGRRHLPRCLFEDSRQPSTEVDSFLEQYASTVRFQRPPADTCAQLQKVFATQRTANATQSRCAETGSATIGTPKPHGSSTGQSLRSWLPSTTAARRSRPTVSPWSMTSMKNVENFLTSILRPGTLRVRREKRPSSTRHRAHLSCLPWSASANSACAFLAIGRMGHAAHAVFYRAAAFF